jgi:hypothetical protein
VAGKKYETCAFTTSALSITMVDFPLSRARTATRSLRREFSAAAARPEDHTGWAQRADSGHSGSLPDLPQLRGSGCIRPSLRNTATAVQLDCATLRPGASNRPEQGGELTLARLHENGGPAPVEGSADNDFLNCWKVLPYFSLSFLNCIPALFLPNTSVLQHAPQKRRI